MKKFLLAYIILYSGIFANPQVSFIPKAEAIAQDLSKYLKILEDTTNSLEFQDVVAKPFSPLFQSNMGYSSSTFWLKWEVENPYPESREVVFVYESTVIDHLSLYSLNQMSLIQETGDRVPFSKRSIDYRNPNFVLNLPPNSKDTLYLKILSQSTIPISIFAYNVESLWEKIIHEQLIYGLYYGWMLVMVFYNLFLYISARFKTYIFYVLFIASLTIFQFILNGFAFQYILKNSPVANNTLLLVFMNLATITGILFSTHYLKTRQTMQWFYRIYQILWIVGLILLLCIFYFSYSLNIRLATIYATVAAVAILVNGILSYLKEIKTAKTFLIANLILLIGVLFYTFKSMGVAPSNLLTNWMILVGSALQVGLLSLGLAERIKELSTDLNSRLFELDETNKKLSSSENRFKRLFNGIGDLIFVLDDNWNFIDINRSITRHLGFKPDEIIGKNLLEIIYKSKNINNAYNRLFIMEKLEELHDTKEPVDFYVEFSQKYVMEPKEFHVKLQYVQLEDRMEILGSASLVIDDILSRYLKQERITFEMDNYLRNAEIISNKLTQHLTKYTDPSTVLNIKTCLREMIINAIEHGNLNITYDEKTQAMAEGNYLQFIQKRQENPRYKNRIVTIEYVLNPKMVAYRITDEGNGFDVKKIMKKKADHLNQELSQHGRGIIMTKDIFDIVEYNDKGNQVSLVKYFS